MDQHLDLRLLIVGNVKQSVNAQLGLQYVPLGPAAKVMKGVKTESAAFKPPHSGSSGTLGKYEYMPCPANKQVTIHNLPCCRTSHLSAKLPASAGQAKCTETTPTLEQI